MRYLSALLILVISYTCNAQTNTIDPYLKAIKDHQQANYRRDSALGHPLGSRSTKDIRTDYLFYDSVSKELNKIDRNSLAFEEQVNLDLLKYSIEDDVYSYTFKAYMNPILADEGFHTSIAAMGSRILSDDKETEKYLAELKDVTRYIDENLALMREGLKLGITQPRIILDNYHNTYDQHIVKTADSSVFWKPFLQRPAGITETNWLRYQSSARKIIMDNVVTGYMHIKTFFDKEYLPGARKTTGVSAIPNGDAYYKELVHHYTTTNMTPEEVYQLGLSEVARISNEMEAVKKQVGFTGDMKAFIKFLRTDPRFYVTSPEQLLKEASYIAKQADGMLPKFFGKLPRQPYGVEAVPAHLAPTYTAGRYSGAPISSKRAGHYWVNTYDLASRPLYALESLTLHEAVPGHHLQISLTQELENLPEFRKNLYVNAFGEGCGLYCEYLGKEMGFYKDPYSYFGRLTYDMWRACRLVIDVGIHAKGWTREQAVEYLAGHTALSLHEVNTEINRYISWPGQALAYKIGELTIKRLRKQAEDALGTRFDIREFHDLILSQGTVTMSILEEMVKRYIDNKKLQ